MATTSPALKRASAGSRALLAGSISATLSHPLAGSAGAAREIGHLAGGSADAGEQGQAIGANRSILVIDENLVKEGIDRLAQGTQRAHGSRKVLVADRIARVGLGLTDGGEEVPLRIVPEQVGFHGP